MLNALIPTFLRLAVRSVSRVPILSKSALSVNTMKHIKSSVSLARAASMYFTEVASAVTQCKPTATNAIPMALFAPNVRLVTI